MSHLLMVVFKAALCLVRAALSLLTKISVLCGTRGTLRGFIITKAAGNVRHAEKGQAGWKRCCIKLNTATDLSVISIYWLMWLKISKVIQYARLGMPRHGL